MADDFSAVIDAEEIAAPDATGESAGEPNAAIEPAAEPLAGATSDAKVDYRKVPAELREFFKTPLGKQAADAWFARAGWHEKFPGGTKEADEILGFLNEHGGRDGLTSSIAELTGKAQELDSIAEKMNAGDPSLIAELVTNSPEGFAKLAPVVMAEWAKSDFDGYNAQLSAVFASTIAQSELPQTLQSADFNFNMLRSMIEKAGISDNPLYPMIVEAFNNLYAGHGKIKEFAGSFRTGQTAQQVKSKSPDLDAREQALNQRDERAFVGDFRNQVNAFREPAILDQLKSFIAKAPGDDLKKELAVSAVRAKVIERMSKDSDYQAKIAAFSKRRDLGGAMKLLKSRESAAIQIIAPEVGRGIYGNAEAAKPVAAKVERAVAAQRPPAVAGRKPTFDEVFDSFRG